MTGAAAGYALSVVTPPAAEPVTAAEAKANARIGHAAEDVLFALWVPAARRLVERVSAVRFVTQTLRLELPAWPDDGEIRLPVYPVQSVTAVRYFDADDVQQTVPGADYLAWLTHQPPRLYPRASSAGWPAAIADRPVEVQFVAGFGPAAAVPEEAKQLVLLVTGYWAENRGDEDAPDRLGLPPGAVRLLRALDPLGYR